MARCADMSLTENALPHAAIGACGLARARPDRCQAEPGLRRGGDPGFRRAHARRRQRGAQPLRRQPAEVHRRARDPAAARRAGGGPADLGRGCRRGRRRSTRRCSISRPTARRSWSSRRTWTRSSAICRPHRGHRRRPALAGAAGRPGHHRGDRPADGRQRRPQPREAARCCSGLSRAASRSTLLGLCLAAAGAGADADRQRADLRSHGPAAPGYALYTFFIKPLTSPQRPARAAGQGLAADPDRHRPRRWASAPMSGTSAPRASTPWARSPAAASALLFYDSTSPLLLPAMILAGVLGGMAWAAIPALPAHALQRQRDPDQPDADLCRAADPDLSGHGPWRDPEGYGFPAVAPVLRGRHHADPGHRHARCISASSSRWPSCCWPGCLLGKTLSASSSRSLGQAPRAARYAGFSDKRLIWLSHAAGRRARRAAGLFEVAGPSAS